jgi:hypothetical protein
VFEYNKENNNTAVSLPLSIILRPAPNLIVSSIVALTDTTGNNEQASIQWTVKNDGALAINRRWTDAIYISADTIFNINNDRQLGLFTHSNALLSLSSSSVQLPVTIPGDFAEGKYYFFVRTDVYGEVNEYPNENDNISQYSNPVFVALPDLHVINLQAPATVQSEQDITINYSVKNAGKRKLFNNAWTDQVFLSPDTLRNFNDISLASVSNRLFKATLCKNTSGRFG